MFLPWTAHNAKETLDTIGKDYSNARVMDFHTLNKPEQDMYDRTKVPRMPWLAYFSGAYEAEVSV